MPATRSHGSATRTHSVSSHCPQPGIPGPSHLNQANSFGQLHISPVPSSRPAQSNKGKQKSTPFVPGEIIEISSDEDDHPPPRRPVAPAAASGSDLRKEVRKLKDSNTSLKNQTKALQNDLEAQKQRTRILETQLQQQRGQKEIVLNPHELEDIIACDICMNPMLVPYILSGCGHTFCKKCLTDWFDTTLRNFLAAHPHYNPNQAIPVVPPHLVNHPAFAHMFPPQPEYACPQCRTPVKLPPVENFGLKALARLHHTAVEGRAPTTPAKSRGSPWDGFFPKR